jgi:PTH1 family peptidyl-tRNA hydrolase
MMRRWLCGLGNPESKYENTRHNAGFMALERFARLKRQEHWSEKHESRVLKLREGERELILIQPLTYMNESGRCLQRWKAKEGLELSELLVVYDDMDLPLGKLRFRSSGSGGSHNGMASIIESLGSEEFSRLRLGIGRPEDPADWADYVLRPFLAEEKSVLEQVLGRAAEAMEAWSQDFPHDRLMSSFNA